MLIQPIGDSMPLMSDVVHACWLWQEIVNLYNLSERAIFMSSTIDLCSGQALVMHATVARWRHTLFFVFKVSLLPSWRVIIMIVIFIVKWCGVYRGYWTYRVCCFKSLQACSVVQTVVSSFPHHMSGSQPCRYRFGISLLTFVLSNTTYTFHPILCISRLQERVFPPGFRLPFCTDTSTLRLSMCPSLDTSMPL